MLYQTKAYLDFWDGAKIKQNFSKEAPEYGY